MWIAKLFWLLSDNIIFEKSIFLSTHLQVRWVCSKEVFQIITFCNQYSLKIIVSK